MRYNEIHRLTEPIYFGVVEHLQVTASMLGNGDTLPCPPKFLVHMVSDPYVEDPSSDIIAVMGNGSGDRVYIWRDNLYMEADITGNHARILAESDVNAGRMAYSVISARRNLHIDSMPREVWQFLFQLR